MKALQNTRVPSALLLGALLLALFGTLVPRAAASSTCPQVTGCGGISMSPASQTAYVKAGQIYDYTYILTNHGNVGTTVLLSVDSAHQWLTSLDPYVIYLDAFSSKPVRLKVDVPPDNHECVCPLVDDVVISTGNVARQKLAKLHLTTAVPVPVPAPAGN